MQRFYIDCRRNAATHQLTLEVNPPGLAYTIKTIDCNLIAFISAIVGCPFTPARNGKFIAMFGYRREKIRPELRPITPFAHPENMGIDSIT